MGTARIVVFGDTHLGFDTAVNARVERRRRGDDFDANFERVLTYTRETRADVLVHCGDFFHTSRVHPSIVDSAFERLAAVADGGIPVLIVPGNHDRSKLPPSLWLGHHNIHVFDRPKTVEVTLRGLRLAFAGFPFAWGDLRAKFPGLADEMGIQHSDADAAFLCLHHTVAGAAVGPAGYVFRGGKDVLSRGALPQGLAAVLAGHIHRHQVLLGDHAPVLYPGSTERTSFAERDEPKGFLDVTLEAGAGRAPAVSWQFVPLPARPMINLDLPMPSCEAHLRSLLAEHAGRIPEDAVVRVSVAGASETPPGLTSTLLRTILPASMNVQLRGEFTRGRR